MTGALQEQESEDPHQLEHADWVRAASLEAHGFSVDAVARVLGVPETYFEAMQASPLYKELLATQLGKQVESNIRADEGWDKLEDQALKRLNEVMEQGFVQKEFALAVAKTANAATRRTKAAQRPLDERSGVRVVLNLGSTFIQQIQQKGMPQVAPPGERIIEGEVNRTSGARGASNSPLPNDSLDRLLAMQRPNLADVKQVLHVPTENESDPLDFTSDQRFFSIRNFDPLDQELPE